MKKALFAAGACALGIAFSSAAAAQTAPMGAEIYGQTVQVRFADGTTNNVMFMQNDTATIRSMDGMSMPATWAVRGGDLCLMAGGAEECWDYNNRFVAGQAMPMMSSCGAASQWTALGVNNIAPPPPPPVRTQPAPAPAPAPMPAPAPRVGERG